MMRIAKQLNKFGGVTYVVNQRRDLSLIQSRSVTFVYSDIVLQHLPPDLASAYIQEFLRVTAPGGIIVFQLPSHRRSMSDMRPAPTPLSPRAYAAEILLCNAIDTRCAPSTPMRLVLTIRNASEDRWSIPTDGLRVGNHWRSAADDSMLVQDDGRAPVPALRPGERSTVTLDVHAPSRPGSYICEIDLVHEGLWWFADQGSQPLRIPLRVSETADHVNGEAQ